MLTTKTNALSGTQKYGKNKHTNKKVFDKKSEKTK